MAVLYKWQLRPHIQGMDLEWRLRAENELNETTEKYETEMEAMRDLVLSILLTIFLLNYGF